MSWVAISTRETTFSEFAVRVFSSSPSKKGGAKTRLVQFAIPDPTRRTPCWPDVAGPGAAANDATSLPFDRLWEVGSQTSPLTALKRVENQQCCAASQGAGFESGTRFLTAIRRSQRPSLGLPRGVLGLSLVKL